MSARFGLTDASQLQAAAARVRHLLDLDADPVAVDEFLAEDSAFAPLVAAHAVNTIPGVPGCQQAP